MAKKKKSPPPAVEKPAVPSLPVKLLKWKVHYLLLALGTVVLLAASHRPLSGVIVMDDSFITYTYAKNLVEHGQFVFNLGDRFLATTTPLYALILTPIYAAGLDLLYAAPALNFLLDLGAALLAFFLARRLFPDQPAAIIYPVFAAAFFLQPYQMLSSTGGMETSLYVLLTALIVWAAVSDRWALAGVIAGLLIITRPDGLIIGCVVFLYHLVAKRKFPTRGFIAFLIVIVPWLAFTFWYFGSPVPTGLMTKAVAGKYFNTPLAKKAYQIYFMPYKQKSFIVLVGVIMGWAGIGWAAVEGFRKRDYRLLILPLFFVLYNVAFILTNTSLAYYWYYVPLFLVLYLHAGYFCARVVSLYRPAAVLVGIWVVALVLVMALVLLPHQYKLQKTRSVSFELGLKRPCEWVREHSRPDATLMVYTVGVPGFYAERKIIDPWCIASPELLSLFPGTGNAERFFLEKTRPDFFLAWDTKPAAMPPGYRLLAENPIPFGLLTYNASWLYQRTGP